MQAVGIRAATFAGTVYNNPNPARHPQRCGQKETDYGAHRCRNSFLKTTFSPIAPKVVTRQWGEEEYNYVTKENYSYLLESAMRYASLLGAGLVHNPGKSTGEGISNIYDELACIIGKLNLNIVPFKDKLEFVLWKYHEWGDHTFYWLPVKFTETLNLGLRRIALSFIHQFMHSNGMTTINNTPDVEWILEYARESLAGCGPSEMAMNETLIKSYESGKIYRLMQRIYNKTYYKNLPLALERYVPNNGFERQLVDAFKEGLQFIGKDKPAIMSYGYDPLEDEDRDYFPVDMERMIRVVYDLDDYVTELLMECANNELRESYDISPVTCCTISPDTRELFSMDRYPDKFFKWFEKICMLIS